MNLTEEQKFLILKIKSKIADGENIKDEEIVEAALKYFYLGLE